MESAKSSVWGETTERDVLIDELSLFTFTSPQYLSWPAGTYTTVLYCLYTPLGFVVYNLYIAELCMCVVRNIQWTHSHTHFLSYTHTISPFHKRRTNFLYYTHIVYNFLSHTTYVYMYMYVLGQFQLKKSGSLQLLIVELYDDIWDHETALTRHGLYIYI